MSSTLWLLIRHSQILLFNGELLVGYVQTCEREILQVASKIPSAASVELFYS
jgi:hypothetical protein